MAKTKISEFSTTPGNNTDINGINIAEGCAPSGINNAIRELMSDLKEWQSGAMDVYVIPQGSIASPGLQLYGDLDTGFYGDAANQLGVAVGGSSVGYFSASGWVGNVVAQTIDLVNIEVTNIKAKDSTTSISLADSTGIATFSKATVIETTDNTNAALRITQLGTGNALLVEDATNPDTTPTVIDQFGNVILGTTARTTPVTSKIEIHGTASELSGLSPSLGFYHWSATASLSSTLTFRHYPSGTVGTLAANTSGDVLGRIVFLSYDGTNAFGASIRGVSGAGGTAPSITYDASGGHNFTSGPIDVENLEVTNIKARDGTAAASIADSTGAITVTKDLTANGVTLGKGLGSVLTNTALGRSALAANTVGDLNTAVGNLSLTSNTGGTGNTAVGHVAMTSHQGGSLNTAVGAGSLTANLNGNNNTAIGQSALGTATGSNNTAVGSAAGSLITNGNKNTIIGNYDGNQGGLDIRTASNYIVLSDGDGNPRAYWNGANATFGGTLTATTITGTQVNSDNLRLDGNTLSSTDTNGNIIIAPDGIGQVHISNTAAVGLYQEIASNSRTPGISSLQVGQGASGEAYVVNRANSYLVLGANGSERARISANGAFRIKGNGTAGTSDAVVINQSAPTDSFVINASGQVGIGTSTLSSTLTVSAAGASQAIVSTTGTNAASSSFSNTGGTVSVGINSSAATPAYAAYISHSGTYPISFYTDSVERARINSDGILSGWSGTNSAPTFSYTNDPNTGMYFPAADAVGFATGGTEKFRITSGGQVNIGGNFTSTNNTLQVTGNAAIGDTLAGPTDGLYVKGNVGIGTNNPTQKLSLQSSSTTYALAETTGTGTSSGFRMKAGASADYTLFTTQGANQFAIYDNVAASERLTLDSSGNLGLGVTPSAWGSGYAALQLPNGGAFWSVKTGSPTVITSANAYFDGTSYKYLASYAATLAIQSGGQHQWYNAPSGTAGNTISFTQAMTLDASGNLGVGETSPSTYGKITLKGGKFSLVTDTAAERRVSFWSTANGNSENAYIQVQNDGATTNTGEMLFATKNSGGTLAERARITAGGALLVNRQTLQSGITDACRLQVLGTSGDWVSAFENSNSTTPYGLTVSYSGASPNGTGSEFLYCADSTAARAEIRSNGGLANYQSNNVDLSDIRTKTDINPLASYWNKIAALEIVSYKYKDQTHDDLNIGVIAQQVEQVAPEFVDPDGFGETPEDGVPLKTIYNKDITFAAIKALQEAMARIEQLEAKVAALEAK